MNNNNGTSSFLMILGSVLVGAGGALLAYLGVLVFQVINAPQEVKIVQFILEHIQIGDKALYGTVGRETFEVHLTEPVRTAIFLFIGILILGVLARILSTLISSGLEMMRMAKISPTEQPSKLPTANSPRRLS